MSSRNQSSRVKRARPLGGRAREDKAALISRLLSRPIGTRAPIRTEEATPALRDVDEAREATPSADGGRQADSAECVEPQSPKSEDGPRFGSAQLQYFAREEPSKELKPQPWTGQIVNVVLQAAESSDVHLCLLWPTRLTSVARLHAIASLERNCATDLRGLRTVFYPGNNATRLALDGVLVERIRLSEVFRNLWDASGITTELRCQTESASFQAALEALNEIQSWSPEVANPALAELIPTFVFDHGAHEWRSATQSPLERSLKKISRTTRRRSLREQLADEWRDGAAAPGALFVLHARTNKDDWQKALTARCLRGSNVPHLLMLDATSTTGRRNFKAVSQIVPFLACARDAGQTQPGAVILADDPKTFFILRAQLRERGLSLQEHVWAGEAEDALLSADPLPADWVPEPKSNANVAVAIVDRDAASLALRFQRLARAAGNEESPAFQSMMAACHYIVRLSNMPAGYADLTEAGAQGEFNSFSEQRNAWSSVESAIRAALAAGALRERLDSVERALQRAQKLIDDWSDATPMAAKLFAEVERSATGARSALCLVLPNDDYLRLARRYLERKFGSRWAEILCRIEWHTLASVGRGLDDSRPNQRFVFVGMNRDVLKLLLAHPRLPHGSALFVPYRQADDALKTLAGMRTLEPFKAYRGRIGLLMQALEARLKEVPNPITIEQLRPFSFKFDFQSTTRGEQAASDAYRFDLEGGGHLWASSWVYRYEPDEDPCFRRVSVQSIQPDDFVFEMSPEMRDKVEQALGLGAQSGAISPTHAMLRLYRDDIERRCAALFPLASNRAALARAIHKAMMALDEALASTCRVERIAYWLHADEDDRRPHGASDWKFFELFCRALQMSDESARNYWSLIHGTRVFNQNQGRALAAQYAEILFQPESSVVYRRLTPEVVQGLRQEAIQSVARVERVIVPLGNQAERQDAVAET